MKNFKTNQNRRPNKISNRHSRYWQCRSDRCRLKLTVTTAVQVNIQQIYCTNTQYTLNEEPEIFFVNLKAYEIKFQLASFNF